MNIKERFQPFGSGYQKIIYLGRLVIIIKVFRSIRYWVHLEFGWDGGDPYD